MTGLEPLTAAVYDVAVLDLDGVVYVGPTPCRGPPTTSRRRPGAGMRLAFVTNNASRPPAEVAAHLRELGRAGRGEDVVTSAQAAARLIAERVPAGAPGLRDRRGGLAQALEELGLEPVQDSRTDPAAVVSGYHPDLPWRTVIDGAILVRRGLPWVASNTDRRCRRRSAPVRATACWSTRSREFAGVEPGGGRQAGAAAVRGDPAPGRRRAAAGGRRPARHRHRGRRRAGLGQPAGDDRGDRARASWCRGRPAAGRPTSPPTWRLLARTAPRAAWRRRLGSSGGWRARRRRTASWSSTGDGRRDDWWRVVAAAAWAHLDATGDAAERGRTRASRSSVAPPDGPRQP